jgi:hypothetical protein
MLAAAWLAVDACRPPTQVTVVVTTSVRCPDLTSGVSVAVAGSPEASEHNVAMHFSSGSTHDCSSDGSIGTLVV